MANTVEFAKVYRQALDKEIVAKSQTGFFRDNALAAEFTNADSVLIPEMDMPYLGNYTDSYPKGDRSVTFKEYRLTMDRGREFSFDRRVAAKTGIGNLAGMAGKEFVRTRVVPEVDAHCIGVAAGAAVTASQTVEATGGALKPVDVLNQLQQKLHDNLDYGVENVIFISPAFEAALNSTPELTRALNVGEFKRGEVSTRVRFYNDSPLLPMKSDLMHSGFDFDAGATPSAGGFKPAMSAKDVYACIVPKKAIAFVSVLDDIKIFDPATYQNGDKWVIQYRQVYDHLIMDSYKTGIWACVPTA